MNNKEKVRSKGSCSDARIVCEYDLAILKENTTQTKVKEQIKLDRLDHPVWDVLIQFIESLILAQDERWRRA